jgi:cytochrome c
MKRQRCVNGFGVSAMIAGICLVGGALAATENSIKGDAGRGKALYQACEACHSIDDNDLGPRHRGVVGRRAGSVADYTYSAALKSSGLTWDEATLDRWLTNPSALVPGTKMFFQLSDAQSRADIVAFLELQK